jgi:hypothetical protein
MPTIIPYPNYIGGAISDWFTNESQRQKEKHDKELAARKKRQKTTAIIGTAVATAATAGLAAPALGLAGAPAVAGVGEVGSLLAGPVGAAGAAGAGTAATAGLLGTGGVVGLGGYLTAGAVGAQIGQQLSGEDYAGAIGTVANTYNALETAQKDQAAYGYLPSRDEKAMFARAALESGSNLGAVREFAQQKGITVPAALQRIQDAHGVRQGELEAQAATMKQRALYDDALSRYTGSDGPLEFAPNESAVKDINAEYDRLNGQIEAFYQSGGTAGRDPSEYNGRFSQLSLDMAKAMRGTPRMKTPRMPIQYADGTTGSLPLNAMSEYAPGAFAGLFLQPDGSTSFYSKGEPERPKKPVRINLGGGNVIESMDDAGVLPDGREWTRTSEGVKVGEVPQTPGKLMAKAAFTDLFKADSTGSIPGIENPSLIGQVIIGSDRIDKVPKLDAALDLAKQNAGRITPPVVAELVRTTQYVYGDQWPQHIESDIDQLDKIATANAEVAQVGPPASLAPSAAELAAVPLGSAARAEAIRQRTSPEAQAIRATETKAQTERERVAGQKRVREASLGRLEQKESLTQGEQILVDNLAAGIDEEVTMVKLAEQGFGRARTTVPTYKKIAKNALTPEVKARLKAEGWSIPGLED